MYTSSAELLYGTIVLRLPHQASMLSPRSNRATTDRAARSDHHSNHVTRVHYSSYLYTHRTPGKDTLFEMQRDLSTTAWISIDRSFIAREDLALLTVTRMICISPIRRRPTEFRAVIFVVVYVRTCSLGEQLRTAVSILFRYRRRASTSVSLNFSCIDFVFAFLSSTNSFEFLFSSPDRLCATFVAHAHHLTISVLDLCQ